MSKKIIVEYWGVSRGNDPMHLHTDTYTPEEWEIENKDECNEEAQNMALEYFEVSGWYEVKEVQDD